MSHLLFVVSDLYPARLSEAASASLPRLPALERWLKAGRRELAAGGWREALRGAWPQRPFRPPGETLASIAAAAVSELPLEQPLWLATPVHFVAGLDSLRLHPAGLLTLTCDEQRVLAADFARVFEGSGWTLVATDRRELLLAGGACGAVHSLDPARALGADPSGGLPSGPGAAPLRRLGAEVEMWLHEHAVNRARAARGQLGANALWLWGGGAPRSMPALERACEPPAAPQGRAGPLAYADDLFVDGLARLTGMRVLPRPDRWPAEAAEGGGDVLCVCELGATPDANSLRALDEAWVAPALAHWRHGAYQSATLLAGQHAIRLQRGSPRQWARALRPVQPWWEPLLQC